MLKFPQTVVGVLGGGQLGRMMAYSAHKMGIKIVALDPKGEKSPAGQVCCKCFCEMHCFRTAGLLRSSHGQRRGVVRGLSQDMCLQVVQGSMLEGKFDDYEKVPPRSLLHVRPAVCFCAAGCKTVWPKGRESA